MFKFRNHLLAAAAVGAFAAGFAAQASATTITLNPENSTPQLSATNGAFNTDNGTISDNGYIAINNTTGAYTESGNFFVTAFNLGSNTVASGVNSNYQIWGTFTASGSGVTVGSTFIGSVTSFNITLNGNAGTGTVFSVPTSTASNGVAPAVGAFNLGMATLIPGTGAAIANAIGTAAQSASLNATDAFSPAAGEAGSTKFFEAPIPFDIDILNASNATSNEIFPAPANCPAGDTCSIIQAGGGNISFETAAIPEPASLALFSMGLFGIGAALRRKNRKV